MRLLVDNDVIHKLAAYDLLPAALRCLLGDGCDFLVGPRTRFSMFVRKQQEKGQRRYGAEVHGRIVSFVTQTRALEHASDSADVDALAAIDEIDAGEKLLFAAAARDYEAMVATGDWRSIEALAGAKTCTGIVQRLASRIVIVEQFLLAAIRDQGFAAVRAKVVANITVDTGIHAWAFGSGERAEEVAACAGLRNRVADLRSRAAGMLWTDPVPGSQG